MINAEDFFLKSQSISIIGCGYVGLTLAGVLLNSGHRIQCFDINTSRIAQLNNKIVPLYEPGLEELLFHSPYSHNLSFTNIQKELIPTDIYYVCVPTPTDSHGSCNLEYVFSAIDYILANTQENTDPLICIKSTIPPLTMQKVKAYITEKKKSAYIVYNPEFMREGTAIQDMYYKNPIVLGSESTELMNNLESFYRGFLSDTIPCIKTSCETAEMIKYSWNSYAAIRIAYINELADLCNLFKANINDLVKGVAFNEQLLPTHTIKPGPGYGGSCLPKDTAAFATLMDKNNIHSSLVHQAIISNQLHKKRLIDTITKKIQTIRKGKKTVSLLGLSFKALTNDIRYSPALDIIKALLECTITIKAYDPKAMHEMEKLYPQVNYCSSAYEAAVDSDLIILLTEWEEFSSLDLGKIKLNAPSASIIDCRNIFDPRVLKDNGFDSFSMGI